MLWNLACPKKQHHALQLKHVKATEEAVSLPNKNV